MTKKWTAFLAGVAVFAVFAIGIPAAEAFFGFDFGKQVEHDLEAQSNQLFGVNETIDHSSTQSIDAATAQSNPSKLLTLAKHLKGRIVTDAAAPNIDMMALWPNDQNPKWIIACNEQGTTNPGVQRIRLSDGLVETILTGTTSCDPLHRTPWGTILFGEEAGGSSTGGGRVYELINPLDTTGVTLDRTTGTFSGGVGSANFAVRPALGRNSYEGLAIYANGIVYYGNELRPSNGTPGGAYYKFVPTTLRDPNSGPISNLAQSPLASGKIYGLRLGLRGGTPGNDYGQATQTGLGVWLEMTTGPDNLQAEAIAKKLTGFYRPEDLAIDLEALKKGNVHFCGNNTGNEGEDHNWGEAICISDGTLSQAATNAAVPELQFFVMGTSELAMADNIAYQPGEGNWIIMEDSDTDVSGHNNDIWDCLEDGADDGTLSDGCVRIATLNDLGAEWTGGVFDASGKRFFVSVQHNVTGKGVVVEITGWK